MNVRSHCTNSCVTCRSVGLGKEARTAVAAARLRPTRTTYAFPRVCRANALTVPCPMPKVPPTKIPTAV
ncbi:hypothetical protein B0H10DRAFT_2376529 [Mycena sp. CBHHK59/15]|nr:hypothetical protein B0H10DRAFT_2376529 [Mycena sp. CBHHK59/15]